MAWSFRSFATLVVFLLAEFAAADSLKAYLDNRQGLKRFAEKSYFQSYQNFVRALNSDPLNPDIQLNIGLTYEATEEWEKAEKAYLSAYELSKGDRQREFVSLFNLAGARSRKNDIEGALKAYQQALEIDPNSLEVKTNIELLWQQQQGKGQSKDGKDGKGDSEGDQDQNQKQKRDGPYQQPKKQPKPFESKDLSKEDVRKILQEIQNQEQSIRAKEVDKGAREKNRDKDW